MDIGTKIRKLREAKNLSQENMACELNMTQNGYGKIERNEVNLKYSTLIRISEILNTPVENIIGYDEKAIFSNFYNKIEQQIHTLYTSQSESAIKALYDEMIVLLQDKIKLLEDKIKYMQDLIDKRK